MGQRTIKVCDICNAEGEDLTLGKAKIDDPGFSPLEFEGCPECLTLGIQFYKLRKEKLKENQY